MSEHRELRLDDPYYRYNHQWDQREAVDLSRSYDEFDRRGIDDDDGNHRGGSGGGDGDDDDWHTVDPSSLRTADVAQADLLPHMGGSLVAHAGIPAGSDAESDAFRKSAPEPIAPELSTNDSGAGSHAAARMGLIAAGIGGPFALGLALGIVLLGRTNRRVSLRRAAPVAPKRAMSGAASAMAAKTAVTTSSRCVLTPSDGATLSLESK